MPPRVRVESIPKLGTAHKKCSITQSSIQEIILKRDKVASSRCQERIQELLKLIIAIVVLGWIYFGFGSCSLWRGFPGRDVVRNGRILEDSLLPRPFKLFVLNSFPLYILPFVFLYLQLSLTFSLFF